MTTTTVTDFNLTDLLFTTNMVLQNFFRYLGGPTIYAIFNGQSLTTDEYNSLVDAYISLYETTTGDVISTLDAQNHIPSLLNRFNTIDLDFVSFLNSLVNGTGISISNTYIIEYNSAGENPTQKTIRIIQDVIDALQDLWDLYKITAAAYTALQAAYNTFTAADNARYTELLDETTANTTAIEAADSEIATINTELATLTTRVTTLETEVAALQSEVTTLQSEVATLITEVAALQTEVATLQTEMTAVIAAEAADAAAIVVVEGEITAIQAEISLIYLALALLGLFPSSNPSSSSNNTTNVTNNTNTYSTNITNVTQQSGVGNSLATDLAALTPSWGSISGTTFTLSNNATNALLWINELLSMASSAGLLSGPVSNVYSTTSLGSNLSTYLTLINQTMKDNSLFSGDWTENTSFPVTSGAGNSLANVLVGTTPSWGSISGSTFTPNINTTYLLSWLYQLLNMAIAAGLLIGPASNVYSTSTLGSNLSSYLAAINQTLKDNGLFSSDYTENVTHPVVGAGNSLAVALAGTTPSWGTVSGSTFTPSTSGTYSLSWLSQILSMGTSSGLLTGPISNVYSTGTVGTNLSTYLNTINQTMKDNLFFSSDWTENSTHNGTGGGNSLATTLAGTSPSWGTVTGSTFTPSNAATYALSWESQLLSMATSAGLLSGPVSNIYSTTTVGSNLSSYLTQINTALTQCGLFLNNWSANGFVNNNTPQFTRLTSGSGSWTAPTATNVGTFWTPQPVYVRIKMWGGGGGGGGGSNTTGTNGTNGGGGGVTRIMNSEASPKGFEVGSGQGGAFGASGGGAGGNGGLPVNATYNGFAFSSYLYSEGYTGGDGGRGGYLTGITTFTPSSPFGGAGGTSIGRPSVPLTIPGNAGSNAQPNTGAGGAGGPYISSGSGYGGGGGGAGGYVEWVVQRPMSFNWGSGTYVIGAGGAGGSSSVGNPGGAGGSGQIIMEWYYQ